MRIFLKRLVLLSLLVSGEAVAAGPVDLIGEFQSSLQQIVDAAEASFDERYQQLEAVVVRTHDMPFIARLTLGSHWSALDDAQRDAFVDRFSELSITNYAARFGGADGVTFRIVGDEPQRRGRHLVRAELSRAGGDPVKLGYLLRDTDDGWRIVNILADGVSDLALKRAEYASVLRDDDFDALLTRLSEQIERLATAN